jgi:hypothetical protein
MNGGKLSVLGVLKYTLKETDNQLVNLFNSKLDIGDFSALSDRARNKKLHSLNKIV